MCLEEEEVLDVFLLWGQKDLPGGRIFLGRDRWQEEIIQIKYEIKLHQKQFSRISPRF